MGGASGVPHLLNYQFYMKKKNIYKNTQQICCLLNTYEATDEQTKEKIGGHCRSQKNKYELNQS